MKRILSVILVLSAIIMNASWNNGGLEFAQNAFAQSGSEKSMMSDLNLSRLLKQKYGTMAVSGNEAAMRLRQEDGLIKERNILMRGYPHSFTDAKNGLFTLPPGNNDFPRRHFVDDRKTGKGAKFGFVVGLVCGLAIMPLDKVDNAGLAAPAVMAAMFPVCLATVTATTFAGTVIGGMIEHGFKERTPKGRTRVIVYDKEIIKPKIKEHTP